MSTQQALELCKEQFVWRSSLDRNGLRMEIVCTEIGAMEQLEEQFGPKLERWTFVKEQFGPTWLHDQLQYCA